MRLLMFLILALTAQAAFDADKFLTALAAKETGLAWNGKPGPCGELSRWQIMPEVWAQHMPGVPFEFARDAGWAEQCARLHLAWLADRIHVAGQRPTPERLATCWHYGASHARRASAWGQEVENLYKELCR